MWYNPINIEHTYDENSIHTLNDLCHCNNEEECKKALNHYWKSLRVNH